MLITITLRFFLILFGWFNVFLGNNSYFTNQGYFERLLHQYLHNFGLYVKNVDLSPRNVFCLNNLCSKCNRTLNIFSTFTPKDIYCNNVFGNVNLAALV